MAGKRGLVMGVANDHSIAWGIARRCCSAHGAQLAFTYQGEAFGRRVEPLADQRWRRPRYCRADVQDDASLDAAFERLGNDWGRIDFIVHAIAYSDKAS
jgi:enoyl-[acyl-carrier protein] reductase I